MSKNMEKTAEKTKKTWQKEDIQKRIERALGCLIKNDATLFKNGANERSLTHKLALYLEKSFPEYHVDCEYNRMWKDGAEQGKQIVIDDMLNEVATDETHATTVYPDIIVHWRENAKNNLLVIEAKKSSNPNRRSDFKKLNAFMREEDTGGRKYEFSAFVVFDVEDPKNSTVEVKDKNENWSYE